MDVGCTIGYAEAIGSAEVATACGPQGKEATRLKLYHGTSWERAQKILRDGFLESSEGLLGPGVYVAREEKARRFARNAARHGGREGGLVTVLVSMKRPKYVRSDDRDWRSQGYDACRADHTSASNNMEWCVSRREQCEVIAVEKVAIDSDAPPVELLPPADPTANFKVTCCGVRPGIVCARPEYPFVKTGDLVKVGETVECRPVDASHRGRLVRFEPYWSVYIVFYALADNSGWLPNVDDLRKRTVHEHSSSQVVLTLNTKCAVRQLPRVDAKKTGRDIQQGDVVIVDYHTFLSENSETRRYDQWFRLCDGTGWLPFRKGALFTAAPFDPEEERNTTKELARIETVRSTLLARVEAWKRYHRESALRVEDAKTRREEEARQEKLRRDEEARKEAARRQEEARKAAARRQEEARRQKAWRDRQAREAAAEAAAAEFERGARGRGIWSSDYQRNFLMSHFSDMTTCVATNGRATLLIYEGGGWSCSTSLMNPLYKTLQSSLRKPVYAALGSNGRHYIEYENGKFSFHGPQEMCSLLQANSGCVGSVAFGADWETFVISFSDGTCTWGGSPPLSLMPLIVQFQYDIHSVSLGPRHEWFLGTWSNNVFWGNTHYTLAPHAIAHYLGISPDSVTFMDFGEGGAWLVRYYTD